MNLQRMKTQQPKVRYWHTSREYISLNRCEQLLCCVLCLLSSYYLPTYFCILLTQPMLDTRFDTVILGLIAIWYLILIMCYFHIFWGFSHGKEIVRLALFQKRKKHMTGSSSIGCKIWLCFVQRTIMGTWSLHRFLSLFLLVFLQLVGRIKTSQLYWIVTNLRLPEERLYIIFERCVSMSINYFLY